MTFSEEEYVEDVELWACYPTFADLSILALVPSTGKSRAATDDFCFSVFYSINIRCIRKFVTYKLPNTCNVNGVENRKLRIMNNLHSTLLSTSIIIVQFNI
jgi:hypothetical protein